MPSLNTLKENFENLENNWDVNITNSNIRNLDKINALLNKNYNGQRIKFIKKII